MTDRAARLLQRSSLAAASPALGVAAYAWFGPSVDTLATGGLAPVLVAGAVALTLGAGLAAREKQRNPPTHLSGGLLTVRAGLEDLAVVGVAVVATAMVLRTGPWWGAAAVLATWLLVALAPARAALAAGPLALVALAVLAGGAVTALVDAPPWTLLQPGWATWSDWLPWSLGAGVFAASVGFGRWRRIAPPGRGTLPWAVVATGLAAWTLIALRAAARFELARSFQPDPLLVVATAGGAAAVVCGAWGRAEGRPTPFALVAALLAAAVLGVAPASASALVVATGLPLLVFGVLLLDAWGDRGATRWLRVGGALVAAATALLAWPGVPDEVLPTAVAAAVVVVGFWTVATRTATRSPA